MADETPQPAPASTPPQAQAGGVPLLGPDGAFPWLLVGGVALAAWWWENRYGKKSKASLGDDQDDDEPEDDDDESPESSSDDTAWSDTPIKRKHKKQLADLRGPISDTYIQPVKLAQDGNCEEAVKLLDRQTRASAGAYGPKKTPIVRRALQRSATVVTQKCPKEVQELVGATEELEEETEQATGLKTPASARAFIHRKQEYQFDPQKGIAVERTRGEAGRFKKRSAGRTLEYRRKGANAYRVTDLETGETKEQRIPTGKPRGRPRKLNGN